MSHLRIRTCSRTSRGRNPPSRSPVAESPDIIIVNTIQSIIIVHSTFISATYTVFTVTIRLRVDMVVKVTVT